MSRPGVIPALLGALVLVTGAAALPGYRRADWPHWLPVDHSCRSARQVVLARDARPGSVVWDPAGCHVLRGTWVDPYTGDVVTDPAELDVDHLVPLAWVAAHGGARWSVGQKAAYANFLDYRYHLQAVRLSANRAKGDRGPEAWVPPNELDRCRYGEQVATVLVLWRLRIPEATRAAIARLVATC